MKKSRDPKKLQLKESQSSQKPISAFFSKQTNIKTSPKKPSFSPKLEILVPSDDDDFVNVSSKKKTPKIPLTVNKKPSSEDTRKRKVPPLKSPELSIKQNAISPKVKDDKKIKLSTNKAKIDANTTAVNILTKGKFYMDDQQRVPDRSEVKSVLNKDYLQNETLISQIGIHSSPLKQLQFHTSYSSKSETHSNNLVNSKINIYTSLTSNKLSPERENIIRKSPTSQCKPNTLVKSNISPCKVNSLTKPPLSPLQQNPSPNTGCLDVVDEVSICKSLFEDDDDDQLVPELDDMFNTDWDGGAFPMKITKLDLENWQRCIVRSVTRNSKFDLMIEVTSEDRKAEANCLLRDNWREISIQEGDILSLRARDENGTFIVDSKGGLVVQWPDTLVSGTSVVGSLFCKRKSILQEHFKGIDCNNKIMTIGSLTHELLQRVLEKKLTRESQIRAECEEMLREIGSVFMLYGAELSYAEAKAEMSKFIPQIVDFISTYMSTDNRKNKGCQLPNRARVGREKSEDWMGKIDAIVDIEENIWSPHLGLKGKVDVTCEVSIYSNNGTIRKLLPLELKTGKASLSAEHRGQVILYTMMMSTLNNQGAFGDDVTEGLLMYLRDKISLREIKAGHPEKRDLIMLRNQLAYYLGKNFKEKKWPSSSDVDRNEDRQTNSDASNDLVLPEPINHHSACGNCAYLPLCSLYLRRDDKINLNDSHPLKKLEKQAVGHLTEKHIEYFIKWVNLLSVEETDRPAAQQLKDIWTVLPTERETNGKCLSNMIIKGEILQSDGRYKHLFVRNGGHIFKGTTHLQAGEYVVVSSGQQYAIASGLIVTLGEDGVGLLLDRNLNSRSRGKKETKLYHIDAPPSSSGLVFNLTNLGLMMNNTEHSTMLRRLIIDLEPPKFVSKLPRRVADIGKPLLAHLNPLQQRAVLKSIAANEYLLIRGMPGTGKSQTCACLIELLVLLGQSVLITSHTHSAVDNLMLRLVDKNLKMLRLGSESRVHSQLKQFTETQLTSNCTTPDELSAIFADAKVVGVTCLGAGHALLSKRQFDVCLVDESTQVLQCCILRPLFAAKKFILIGDPDQLPPIVRSDLARSSGMEDSLFVHLNATELNSISLSSQYRMNRPINELANRLTYEHKLTCANEVVENGCLTIKNFDSLKEAYSDRSWLLKCMSPKQEFSVLFLDTGPTFDRCLNITESHLNKHDTRIKVNKTDDCNRKKMNCSNIAEAAIVLRIIREFNKCGVASERIGVITPYRDQVALLKVLLVNYTESIESQSIEVNTVDQFQGRDKDIVLYSCAKTWNHESNKKYEIKDVDILQDHRRLTVAVTRAKFKLILIGDKRTLLNYKPFKRLLGSLTEQQPHNFNFHNECTISLPELMIEKQFSFEELFDDIKEIM